MQCTMGEEAVHAWSVYVMHVCVGKWGWYNMMCKKLYYVLFLQFCSSPSYFLCLQVRKDYYLIYHLFDCVCLSVCFDKLVKNSKEVREDKNINYTLMNNNINWSIGSRAQLFIMPRQKFLLERRGREVSCFWLL